jgi:K+-sensing histidine kinase KdpD
MGVASIGRVPRAVMAYGVSFVSSVATLLASWLMAPVDSDNSTAALVFLAAVGISGWYGGLGPALFATVFGAVSIDYFFETPRNQIQVTNGQTLTDLLSFLLVAILLGSLNAQAAVEARDDLMATVSHELRTPLTAIKTSVYSLRDRTLDLPMEKRDVLLATIELEANRLAHFVAGALALRRLENGLSPQWQLTAPAEVASAALDRCAPLLGSHVVRFAVADELPAVRVDPSLLDQALTVLIENVAVHTPPDTPISIEAWACGRDLGLEVIDAGPGIPPSARQRIFEKYERLARPVQAPVLVSLSPVLPWNRRVAVYASKRIRWVERGS